MKLTHLLAISWDFGMAPLWLQDVSPYQQLVSAHLRVAPRAIQTQADLPLPAPTHPANPALQLLQHQPANPRPVQRLRQALQYLRPVPLSTTMSLVHQVANIIQVTLRLPNTAFHI